MSQLLNRFSRGACPLVVTLVIGCTGEVAGSNPGDTPAVSGGQGSGASASGGSSGSGSGNTTAGGTGTMGGTASTTPGVCETLTERRVRRLARREYVNVVTDLLGAKAGTTAAAQLAAEPRVGGFDNQSAALFVSPSLQEDLADLAAELATAADPATLAPCADMSASAACLDTFVAKFGKQAYGRPLTADELARVRTVTATGESYASSVRLVVELVLQSPNLLYVSELGALDAPVASQQPVALTPYEVASQLSFLLTGTRPDATLLQAAETTGFKSAADIRKEAERMLADGRAEGELTRFVVGWLDMAPVAEAPKSEVMFPELTTEVVTAMQQEFDAFVKTQLRAGEGSIADFMNGTSTNIPAALKTIYGADLTSSGLDPNHRKGVLSLPGLLTFHSANAHSGPVERGLLVRRQLLCDKVPPPPQNAVDRIAANPVDEADVTKTTRQKYSQHVDEPSCKACHASFDPIGFGLEQMDGIGRFRTTENGLPVDSSGELTRTDVDGLFEGPAALSAKLAGSKQLEACMVEHYFNFAMARQVAAEDACVVQGWGEKFEAAGGKIKELVLSSVVDRSFAMRKEDR